jgi:hypothetical protein
MIVIDLPFVTAAVSLVRLGEFQCVRLDFLIAHYCLTRRVDTPFWRAVKHETYLSPSLQARLDVFRKYLPTYGTKGKNKLWLFADVSWFSVLLGMNFRFDDTSPSAEALARANYVLETKRNESRSSGSPRKC